MSSISIQESTNTPTLTQVSSLSLSSPVVDSAVQQRTSLLGAGTISASSSAIIGIVESRFDPEITITPAELAKWSELNRKIELFLQRILNIPSPNLHHNSSITKERADRIMRHDLLNSTLESELKDQEASMAEFESRD